MAFLQRLDSERFAIYDLGDRIIIVGEEQHDIIVLNNYDELAELRDLINAILPDDFPNE